MKGHVELWELFLWRGESNEFCQHYHLSSFALSPEVIFFLF